jgi:DHA3 family macrolide efflux protein-like MFS transporter
MARSPLVLAAAALLLMLPLPMIEAPFVSMMQAKVPPDLQGRVFAVTRQISLLLTPIAHLLVGPLADRVFEPAIVHSGWTVIAPIVGDGAGSGMGLMILLSGALTATLTAVMYAHPAVRSLEAELPDYIPAHQVDNVIVTDSVATQPANLTFG